MNEQTSGPKLFVFFYFSKYLQPIPVYIQLSMPVVL